jgi:thiamine pyrophosphokinase
VSLGSSAASVRPGPSDAIVLAGGDPVDASLAAELPTSAVVIAADGGLALAAPLGLEADLLVGDLDSVADDDLRAAQEGRTVVQRHPSDKDATDLELALRAAVATGAERITVVGGAGGRADHLLAHWLLLASDLVAGCSVRSWSTTARTDVVRPGRATTVTGPVGTFVSLLPVHGAARGITTSGLRFPLRGETLHPGSSRGVSNRFDAPEATVALTDGVLLVVRPLDDTGGTP